MKEELLSIIEKNSRIDLNELAGMLGQSEIDVANAVCELERDGVIGGFSVAENAVFPFRALRTCSVIKAVS